MASLPTGVNLPPPTIPGTQPQPPAPDLPDWWNKPSVVMIRVLSIAEFDPQAAAEIWHEYKRLTGK